MQIIEMIYAACTKIDKEEFTAEDIAVVSFKDYPDVFAMRNYDSFPDLHKIYNYLVNRSWGLLGSRALIRGSARGLFRLGIQPKTTKETNETVQKVHGRQKRANTQAWIEQTLKLSNIDGPMTQLDVLDVLGLREGTTHERANAAIKDGLELLRQAEMTDQIDELKANSIRNALNKAKSLFERPSLRVRMKKASSQ